MLFFYSVLYFIHCCSFKFRDLHKNTGTRGNGVNYYLFSLAVVLFGILDASTELINSQILK